MFWNNSTTVVNKYDEDFDVLIQRGTIWGNPFKDGTRRQNIERFKPYFLEQIRSGNITLEQLRELRGKRLGCSCSPCECHGDFIAYCVDILDSDMYTHEAKEKFFNMELKITNEH